MVEVVAVLVIVVVLAAAAIPRMMGTSDVAARVTADRVLAREGVILNPHYKGMGNLYGSEYWTYLLPRRVGAELAAALTQNIAHSQSEQEPVHAMFLSTSTGRCLPT